MNCYTWMELMKQGLEVLWWKHNMIPTKGSIQHPPPPKHPPTPGQPPTSDIHALTFTPHLLFTPIWLKPEWTSGGTRLVEEAQKVTPKVFTSSFPPVLHWGFFQRNLLKKEKSSKTLEVLKSAKVLPCMVNTHFWHTLSFRLEWAHLKDPIFRGLFYFYKYR